MTEILLEVFIRSLNSFTVLYGGNRVYKAHNP